MTKYFKIFLLLILAFFIVLMLRISLPYVYLEHDVAFLRIKQWVIHNPFWRTAFFIHVFSSVFCLIAGFTQFSKKIRTDQPRMHKTFGYIYLIIVLGLSGPSGLLMSFYANGGMSSQIGFGLLSVLWLGTTFLALLRIKKRDFSGHQNFMIRSYALALSAVTLRSWKWLIVLAFRPPPMDTYILVAWLGWIPNLIFAEWLIWSINKKASIKLASTISNPRIPRKKSQ